MPSKNRSRVTDAQREKIAAGRAAGKTHREIAAETGLARKTVDRQATDPRTVTLTLELKQQNAPQIRRMFGLTLDTMEADLRSNDASRRATARAQLLRLLPLGDPPLLQIAPVDPSAGDFTLEELLIELRRDNIGRG